MASTTAQTQHVHGRLQIPWYIPAATFFCFLLSGGTALIYQVAWVRHMTLIFGSTAFAVSTVLTAFMAGLALGSYLFGRWIDRHGSPLVTYAGLEAVVGAYALAIPAIFGALVPIYQWVWDHLAPTYYLFSLIRFVLAFLALMIPTTCMGGTLPVLSKFYALAPSSQFTLSVSTLYAVNTFGAVLGTVLSGFWMIPTLGLAKSVLTASVINLSLAGVIVALVGAARPELQQFLLRPQRASMPAPVETDAPLPPSVTRYVLFSFALTGFAALTLEVAWTRVLSLVLGPSVYAFSVMLATFLIGLALGSFAFARVIAAWKLDGLKTLYWLQAAIGVTTFLTLVLFNQLPFLFATIFHRWGASQSIEVLFGLEFLIAFAVMYLPTFFMGGIFPAIVKIFSAERGAAGRTIGRIYAANTLGAILGSFSAGFILIPWIGIQNTVLVAIGIYLILSILTGRFAFAAHASGDPAVIGIRRLASAVPAAAALLWILLFTPDWNKLIMSSGMFQYAPRLKPANVSESYIPTRADFNAYVNRLELLFYKEGHSSTITVAREKQFQPKPLGNQLVESILLINNGKIDASSYADMPTQILLGHLGVLLHPDPKDVLVIGLASGTTAGSALQHPIESLTVVEIEEAMVEASRYFDHVSHAPLQDPRTTLVVNDGRNFLLVTHDRYDVIISEPSNPWMSGPSNLFTKEFFQLAHAKLNDNGIFVQWVQMYAMSPGNLKALIKTVQAVFPAVHVFSGLGTLNLLLVASNKPIPLNVRHLYERLERPAVRADLARMNINSVTDLLAHFRLGPQEVAALVQDAPLNTDDNALIEFAAPKDLFRSTVAANNRLIVAATKGITPYIEGLEESERSQFFTKLSAAYRERGFKVEAELAAKAAR